MNYVGKGQRRLALLCLLLGTFFVAGEIVRGIDELRFVSSGQRDVSSVLRPFLFLAVGAYIYFIAWEALARFVVTDEYFTKSPPFGFWTTTVRFDDVIGYHKVLVLLHLGPFAHKLVVDTAGGRITLKAFMGPEYHVILEQLNKHVPERREHTTWSVWPW